MVRIVFDYRLHVDYIFEYLPGGKTLKCLATVYLDTEFFHLEAVPVSSFQIWLVMLANTSFTENIMRSTFFLKIKISRLAIILKNAKPDQ